VLGHAIGFDAFIRCDAAAVLEHADELAAYCAEHGLPYWGAIALLHRGNQLVALDRPKQGLHVLTEAWDTYRAIGAVSSAPGFLISLAIALARLGRATEGLKQIDQATRHVEATDERCREAALHRTRGEPLMAVGDPVGAEISFQRSIAVAHQQNAKVSELHAATSLACLWRDQVKRQQAQDLLTPIYGWFTEGFDMPVLQDAKARLDELM
jgi:predicted ATPase